MPGRDILSKAEAPAADNTTETSPVETPRPGVYYNARLDPKNYLEGPLSHDPATRLRQMLARPGIVVSLLFFILRNIVRSTSNLEQIAPGICDGISARCALEAGFDCLYQRLVTVPVEVSTYY